MNIKIINQKEYQIRNILVLRIFDNLISSKMRSSLSIKTLFDYFVNEFHNVANFVSSDRHCF